MSIKGTLDTFDLATLLQMLKYEKKTGRLTIKSKANQVQIFLQEGDIVFATESRKSNRIGLLLMNHGLISRKALDKCLALSRQNNLSIGKVLVQEGYLSPEKLNSFILKQAENSIYNVFLWDCGDFVYSDCDINMKRMAGGKFNTMNILLEASRRVDELDVLKKQIPDDNVVLKRRDEPEEKLESKLNDDEKRFLSLINGYSTVNQLLDETGWDDFTGYKIINSLISAGCIEIVGTMPARELAGQVVIQLRGIDGRQFREALDKLGLKRSSILRVILTRIFREASDKDQLLESVENESQKIAGSPEEAELYSLKEKTYFPFINSLLGLLYQAVNNETAGR